MVTGVCKLCGKERDYAFKSQVKDYCSYICSNTAKWEVRQKAEMIEFQCLHCKNPFFIQRGAASSRIKRAGKILYCSRSCLFKHKLESNPPIPTDCLSCGKVFDRSPCRNTKYCSATCASTAKRRFSPWSTYSVDRESRREYFRNYVSENREKLNLSAGLWKKKNRDYANYISAMRRSAGSLTRKEWKSIIDENPNCAHCLSADRLEVDHIVPVSKGGKTERSNLQILCRKCNASKGNRERPLTPKAVSEK